MKNLAYPWATIHYYKAELKRKGLLNSDNETCKPTATDKKVNTVAKSSIAAKFIRAEDIQIDCKWSGCPHSKGWFFFGW